VQSQGEGAEPLMSGDTIGVGLIGYSWIARAHVHALESINHIDPLPRRIRLVSIAGRTPDRVAEAAARYGFARWTTSWESLVDDPEVDVVGVLATNDLHAPASLAAIDVGKPVLCEKPLGRDATEAREMLDAAEAAGVTHACGFNYRYVPAVRLAHDLVRSGRLGRLRHFRALYLQDFAGRQTAIREHGGGGAVVDYSHIVDLMLHLGGEPRSSTALVGRFDEPERPAFATEDAYAATLELEGGGVATLEASRCATGWKGRQRIEANGSDGSFWWDMEDLNRLHVFLAADETGGYGGFRDVLVTEPEHPFVARWWTPGHVLGWEHSFAHQWRDFLSAVLEGRPVPPEQASFEDGYRAARVCDAILTAAEEGRRIEIEPVAGSSVLGANP
jgi:predicted dehydrogenase